MSYEQIKNQKHFDQFVKKFQSQRKNITSAIISRKIGEEAVAEDILKAATPVVEAIKQQTIATPAIHPITLPPAEQLAIDSDDQSGSNTVVSQKILSDVMTIGQLSPTTFELNVGSGKIGTGGMIDLNKLLNEDKIIFSSDSGGFKIEIPKTTGLLYLLLAPYKFIKANNLRGTVITKEDEVMYARVMQKAGMDSKGMNTSTKFKTMIKGVDTSPPLQMKGDGLRSKRNHKINSDGTFGAISIDMPMLLNSNRLKAHKNDKVVLNRKVSDDFIDLVTKRYNSKNTYSENALRTYRQLLDLAELSLSSHSKKFKAIKDSTKKIYYKDTKELANRLKILLGEIEAGNNNVDIKNEAMEIMDTLLEHKVIDRGSYKELYRALLNNK